MNRQQKNKKNRTIEHKFKSYWELRHCFPYVIYIEKDSICFKNREYIELLARETDSVHYPIPDMETFLQDIDSVLEKESGKYYFYSDSDAPYCNSENHYPQYQRRILLTRQALEKQGLNLSLNFAYCKKGVMRDHKIVHEIQPAMDYPGLISYWYRMRCPGFIVTTHQMEDAKRRIRNIVPSEELDKYNQACQQANVR